MRKNLESKLKVIILSRDGQIFKGEAEALSGVNELGAFDVLPHHSQFVTTIKDKLTVYLGKKSKKEFKASEGVLWVKGDEAKVFLGV